MVLAVAAGCDVTAVHVDHGLRANSADDAGIVRDAAARFGARFVSHTVTVPPGPNLEARARSARFGVLPKGVLTGHTADDQAETILLNLVRGAGLDGLSGMPSHGHPLLRLRRHETEHLCAHVGLLPVRDPSNESPAHRRNRVRHEVVPLLDDVAGRDVTPVLVRQAALLRSELELLDRLAGEVDPTDARSLVAADLPLARRALRRWLADPYPPDAATIERVLAVARGEWRSCELSGGRRVERRRQRLSIVSTDGVVDERGGDTVVGESGRARSTR
jgi:tRNA(Ile)-lysidine synthase